MDAPRDPAADASEVHALLTRAMQTLAAAAERGEAVRAHDARALARELERWTREAEQRTTDSPSTGT